MEEISFLLKRFFESQKGNAYFDVDEIVSLIDYFLDEDDILNLKNVIELGYKLHPDDMSFKISLCKTLVSIEDFDSALKLIDEIGLRNNNDLDLMKLECYCELDRYEEALDFIYEIAVENNACLEDALIQTACIMNDTDKYRQDAYDFIMRSLAMFPGNLTLKSELCFNLELQGKIKEALTLCDELISEDPHAAETWYMQGRLYSLCADFERSIDSLDFALTCIQNKEPEYEIKLMKAYCLYQNKNYQQAISTYEELASYDEYIDSEVEPSLVGCYICLKNFEKAYEILKHTITLEDLEDKTSVFGNFIGCCMKTERYREAIDFLNETMSDYPGILEYLSISNADKDPLSPHHMKIEKSLRTTSHLVRKYIESHLHNN